MVECKLTWWVYGRVQTHMVGFMVECKLTWWVYGSVQTHMVGLW